MTGFLCGPKTYEFEGWFFEIHSYVGPWPLNKDHSLRKRAGRSFYEMVEKFDKLTELEKETYRVGGVCIAI